MLSFDQTLAWIMWLIALPVAAIEAIAKRLVFPDTAYFANAICTGTCPNGTRTISVAAFDVADSVIPSATFSWRVQNTATVDHR